MSTPSNTPAVAACIRDAIQVVVRQQNDGPDGARTRYRWHGKGKDSEIMAGIGIAPLLLHAAARYHLQGEQEKNGTAGNLQ